MEELNDLLKKVSKMAENSSNNLIQQQKNISKLEDGREKDILRMALKKAKNGDVEGVTDLIKRLRNGN